jgi:hypothetical protein
MMHNLNKTYILKCLPNPFDAIQSNNYNAKGRNTKQNKNNNSYDD